MYGLPQAGILAQRELVRHLATHGYRPCANTVCLFEHVSRPIMFTLVVDDFGIKYSDRADLDHFLAALRTRYDIKTAIEGDTFTYNGYTINFDYTARTCNLSMPGYIDKALARFNVAQPTTAVDSPMLYTAPDYGQKSQLATADHTALLDAAGTKHVQEIVGVLLYYARAVDPTMLCAVSKIGSAQAKPTRAVLHAARHILEYAACHPNASITYRESDMRLITHSDASYLSETQARSRAGGFHFLGTNAAADDQPINGGITCTSSIIPAICSSATEAEYAALFINACDAEGLRLQLHDLHFPQDASPLISDNKCAVGIGNSTVKIRRTKAMDMRWHWVRDRIRQKHFTVSWYPGKDNLADFFTKAHPATHHRDMRNYYVG
jgi:hypothetical protein